MLKAINQDPLGVQGVPVGAVTDPTTTGCWAKPLQNGDVAAIIINSGDGAATVSCTLADLGLKGKGVSTVRDLWGHAVRGLVFFYNLPSVCV
jgi:alpha-galactosidase